MVSIFATCKDRCHLAELSSIPEEGQRPGLSKQCQIDQTAPRCPEEQSSQGLQFFIQSVAVVVVVLFNVHGKQLRSCREAGLDFLSG